MATIENTGQHPINVFAEPTTYGVRQSNVNPAEFAAGADGIGATSAEVANKQLVPYAFLKKAIMDIRKDMTFQQLATTREMMLNSGKTIKMYRYLPVIDDRNINDQGIDANGLITANGNLWGSSRDPGTIKGRFPNGRETGGRILAAIAA